MKYTTRRESTASTTARFLSLSIVGTMLALTGCGASSSSSQSAGGDESCEEGYQVDILLQAQVPLFDDMVAGFKTGFTDVTGLEPNQVEYNEQNAQGDSGNYFSLARSMATSDSGLVAVIGTAPTIALAKATKTKPIVSISMTDPVASKVSESLERPGTNVTGSQATVPIERIMEDLKLIQPEISTIGTIYSAGDEYMANFTERMVAAGDETGIEVDAVSVTSSSDVLAAARSLTSRVDALLIGQDGTVATAMPAIASTAKSASVPLYLGYRDEQLQPGIVGGISDDWTEIGRLAGVVAGEICQGADPAEVPWAVYSDQAWYFQESELEVNDLNVPEELRETAEVLP